MELLEHLTQEHRKAERLLEQLADSDEGADRERALSELESSLSTHMAVEERFLYPIVTDVVGAEEEQGAEAEHELTRDGLAKMRELVAAPGFGAAVDMLKAGIAHHVQEEEEDIFPKLRQEAAGRVEQLGTPDELESKVKSSGGGARTGEVSGEATRDELYEQAKAAGIEGRSQMTKEELRDAISNQ